MIHGTVTDDGIPTIQLEAAGRHWKAIVDTGFNGELELPQILRNEVGAKFVGRVPSLLAANQQIEEDIYLVTFPFDGHDLRVQATFIDSGEILLGTGMLQNHSLWIDFPMQTVEIKRN